MKRWLLLAVALVLLAVAIVGCGSSGDKTTSAETEESKAPPAESETETEGASGGGTSKISVSYLTPILSLPGQQQAAAGMKEAAAELGWSATVLDSNLSADKQVSNMETALSRGDGAIALNPLDPGAMAGAYAEAESKGVPVIGMNAEGKGLAASVWYEYQLCDPGGPQAISAEMIAKLHPHAKTIMVGAQIAESTRELSACFKKEAEKAGLEILTEGVTEIGNTSDAQKIFEPLLTKYPEVEAVWAFNDESAIGAAVALQAAGKEIATLSNPDGVVVTGMNGEKVAIEAVEDGRMSWTWDPDNVANGFAAVKVMKEVLDGKSPGQVVVESELVDSETVGEYVPPEQRDYTLDNLPLK